MKIFLLRIISIGIIAIIVSINVRTLLAYFSGKREVSNHELHFFDSNRHDSIESEGENIKDKETKSKKNNCKPFGNTTESKREKKIILRMDDIGKSMNVGLFKKFVIDTQRLHIPMVLGIIPEGLESNPELLNFLQNESCNLEFAVHGWDHFSAQSTTGEELFITEFSGISVEDAALRIKKAKKVLEKISTEPIITFTPPYNTLSQSGIMAAQLAGMYVISSIGDKTFDAHKKVNNYEMREPFSKITIANTCKDSLEKTNICVILLQLQDFFKDGTNEFDRQAYSDYLSLLEDYKKYDVEFTTFRNLQKNWPEFSQYSLIK